MGSVAESSPTVVIAPCMHAITSRARHRVWQVHERDTRRHQQPSVWHQMMSAQLADIGFATWIARASPVAGGGLVRAKADVCQHCQVSEPIRATACDLQTCRTVMAGGCFTPVISRWCPLRCPLCWVSLHHNSPASAGELLQCFQCRFGCPGQHARSHSSPRHIPCREQSPGQKAASRLPRRA